MLNEKIHIRLSSNPKMATFLRNCLEKSCQMVGFPDEQSDMIILAVDEAFTNVIRHGYKMDFTQKIDVSIQIREEKEIEIKMQDDAPLIDISDIRSRDLKDIQPGGLGIHFLYSIMDKVEFTIMENRNALIMKKFLVKREKTRRLSMAQQNLLQTLLDIGRYVHQTLELDSLLGIIVNEVKKLIDCESVSVILQDRKTEELFFHTVLDENQEIAKKLLGLRFASDKGIAGKAFASGETLLVKDVENHPSHYNKIDKDTGGKTSSLLYAPLKIKKRVIGLLGVKNKMQGVFSVQDTEAVVAIANTVALSIDNAYSHETLQETSSLSKTTRITKEFESARLMQQAILPQVMPDIKGLEVSAICQPAAEIGGDYFDFIELLQNKHAFAVGDVSGHGLEAGIVVSMARSCLYTQVNFSNSISEVMRSMNRMVCSSTGKTFMMTFMFSIYDTESRMLKFANAGHPYPYHYIAEKNQWTFVKNGEFPLGIYEDYEYKTHSLQLHSNDFLILYSDGIIEAVNKEQDHYGFDRFSAVLKQKKWKCPKQLEHAILKDVRAFCGSLLTSDDLTLMVIHVLETPLED